MIIMVLPNAEAIGGQRGGLVCLPPYPPHRCLILSLAIHYPWNSICEAEVHSCCDSLSQAH